MAGDALIVFWDEKGVRWTVTRQLVPASGVARLEFQSDAGEQRSCDVIPLDEQTWGELNELAWQMLLRGTDAP